MTNSETWNWFDGKRITMKTAYWALMDGQAIRNKTWEKINIYL